MVDLERFGSPFFNIDALAFIGDLAGRDTAVEKASRKFQTEEIAREWRRLEARGRVAGLSRPAELAPEPPSTLSPLEWLERYFETEDWPKRWLGAWTETESRNELKHLGQRRLEVLGLPGDIGPVIQVLLTDAPFNDQLYEPSLRWLSHHHNNRSWFTTWDMIRRKIILADLEFLPNQVLSVGLDALHRAARLPHLMQPADWARLWSRLFSTRGDQRHHLVGLALGLERVFFDDPIFQQKVLWTIAKRRRERVEKALTPWLLSTSIDNGWIGVYVRLDQGRIPIELKHQAVEFLAYGDVRYKGWRTLWTTMRKDPLLNAPFDEFAHRWLHRASRHLTAWPEVLADMVQLHPHSKELRDLATSWLKDNPRGGRLRLIMEISEHP